MSLASILCDKFGHQCDMEETAMWEPIARAAERFIRDRDATSPSPQAGEIE